MSRISRIFALLLSISATAAASPVERALAAESEPVKTPNVTARLVSERIGLAPGGTTWLALHLVIRDGWHTYWVNPGDAGEKTEIAWTLPRGFKAGDIAWPAPQRLYEGPVAIYGYEKTAVHLVPITASPEARPGEHVRLEAEASWLVCEKICIPEQGRFTLTVPIVAGQAPVDRAQTDLFERARRELPKPLLWDARIEHGGDELRLRLAGAKLDRARIADIWFYPTAHGALPYAAPQRATHDGKGLTLSVKAGPKLGSLAVVPGVLVIKEKLESGTVTQAFEVSAAVVPAAASDLSLPLAFLFALLGGVILNLMPCVFPVLSLKALSFAAHAERGGMTRHGLAYTGGVLICFAAIGHALVVLRGVGTEIGWGFQLQEPVFVMAMAYVMFAIGLNLSGLYSIGGAVMGAGGALTARSGLSGSFFTGVLAAVVATPCTAPLMGAALGFALMQAAPAAFAIVLTLGLGMALPFLALSASPRLLRYLPKPGPWMERFRQVLAFPMFATAAWLLWVLSLQSGTGALLAALAGAILIAFALWLWQATKAASARGRTAGVVVALLGLAGAAALIARADAPSQMARALEADPRWIPFTPNRLDELRAAGKPVFVNFTAAWCVSCIVNEQVVLRSDAVWAALKRKGVVAMKADWTRRDPEVSRALAEFGRSGVPLYVLLAPPRGTAPSILPEILTEGILIDAIAQLPDAQRAQAP